jgi:hypothetical protein
MTTIYKNKLFDERCCEYAITGFVFLKQYFTIYKSNNAKVKKYYIGNDGDNEYDDFHYYIEITNDKKKYIIDNTCIVYNYYEYKDRFKPKQIKTLTMKEINEYINLMNKSSVFTNSIYPQIIKDFEIHLQEIE